ncbi:MAG: AraC family ligand binding domain-containing protein [Bacteroidia bacterium]|nr:AraC family ligand binding domain-containing protein [Bacteroidia bacterium]
MSPSGIIPTFDFYKTLDNDLRFEFCRLEESYNPYDTSLPHRHNYYEILFFNDSGGTHEIDFNNYPVQKNTLHFISPEQVHMLRREKQVTGFVLSFTSEFCLTEKSGTSFINNFPFFNNPYASPLVKMKNAAQQKEMSDIIFKVQEEYNSDHPDKADVLFNWLSIFLITARRFYVVMNNEGKSLPV